MRQMEKIKIITDSTADLPKEVYEKYDIEVLPLLINFGEESYLDGVEITPEVLFERIEKEGSLPTTAQVIPNRFMDTYKKYLDDGYKIISIHISSNERNISISMYSKRYIRVRRYFCY